MTDVIWLLRVKEHDEFIVHLKPPIEVIDCVLSIHTYDYQEIDARNVTLSFQAYDALSVEPKLLGEFECHVKRFRLVTKMEFKFDFLHREGLYEAVVDEYGIPSFTLVEGSPQLMEALEPGQLVR